MKRITTDIDDRQDKAFAKLSPKKRGRGVSRNEHIRRALDIYLSTPSIMAELKRAKRLQTSD